MKNLKLILATLSLTVGASAFAIPAKLGVRQLKQPDGSSIAVKLVGNRNLHFYTTVDDQILIQDNDGFFCYAELTERGDLISTDIRPVDSKKVKGVTLSPQVVERIKSARVATRALPQEGMGLYQNYYPTKGSPKVPVILVEFQDVKFSDTYDATEYFTNLVSGDNFEDPDIPGSIKQYFSDQSHGAFVPDFDIYGPITVDNDMAYYGANLFSGDDNAHKMVAEAVKQLDSQVDFSQYDVDKNGDIDFVYIIYAGYGENRDGGPDSIWPHAGMLKRNANFVTVDGVWVNSYACSNELISEGNPEGPAAFIHEFSHIIGLPDLYPTDDMVIITGEFDYTPGYYSILDYGVYVNDGKTPPNYSAFERNAVKWDTPILIEEEGDYSLDEISTGQFYLIPTDVNNEFFLLENRQQQGWDRGLTGHGLLIWHIDYQRAKFQNNEVNNKKEHQLVELIRANNEVCFGHPLTNQEGFPFPGTSQNTEFSATSTPAMLAWSGYDMNMPVTNIAEKDGVVTFRIGQGSDDDEEDGTTGVAGIDADANGLYVVYNVSGVKVAQGNASIVDSLPKGLYIINGKKVVVK